MSGAAKTRARTTLASIAEAAGVSPATVSKVANGRLDVAPQTRARIEQLLVAHGYVRRGAPAPPGRTRALCAVFDGLTNPNNLEIIRGVVDAARHARVEAVVEV